MPKGHLMDYTNNNGEAYVLEPLISEQRIRETVNKVAERINKEYERLHIIGLLKGSFVFMSDLIRQIEIPVTVDFMAVSSYIGTQSSGEVKILKELNEPIYGKDVCIVEDIIDTGLTLEKTIELLNTREPKRIDVYTLLDKAERRVVDIGITYNGITIPDEFIVGYGIDYEQRHRELPSIQKVKFI